jgi:thiol-disulfide isomerase/thioredoxin
MVDDTRSNDRGSGAVTQPGPARSPGLIRSIVHRLAGERAALPVEGRLASLAGATRWLNSQPLTPEGLRGRVVLVDFWTYTCVNWLRTLPYLRAWATKYADAGLTIVGIHTPEFGFEHDVDNVTAQVRTLAVDYPVAVDNDYAVWRAFSNHYWPALYLADADGRLRYHHFGEGEYAMAEMAIQQLLLEAGATDVDQNLVMVEPRGLEVAADWRTLQSPETYLGYAQSTGFASQARASFDRAHRYTATPQLPLNYWDLSGTWTVAQHAALLDEPGGRVAFEFHARDVNLVMGPAAGGEPIPFRVFLDGEPAIGAAGTDVAADGHGTVTDQRTYQLIRQSGPIAERRFEIEFLDAGAETYCFTFG